VVALSRTAGHRNPRRSYRSGGRLARQPGQQDLEWVVIAACGPHRDAHFVAGGGNAFDRWRGVFDGLHLFMGYGAVTFDKKDEGARLVDYARDGDTIQHAWFRAAKGDQPHTNGEGAPNGPNVYVT
jgi:hypothetical protein